MRLTWEWTTKEWCPMKLMSFMPSLVKKLRREFEAHLQTVMNEVSPQFVGLDFKRDFTTPAHRHKQLVLFMKDDLVREQKEPQPTCLRSFSRFFSCYIIVNLLILHGHLVYMCCTCIRCRRKRRRRSKNPRYLRPIRIIRHKWCLIHLLRHYHDSSMLMMLMTTMVTVVLFCPFILGWRIASVRWSLANECLKKLEWLKILFSSTSPRYARPSVPGVTHTFSRSVQARWSKIIFWCRCSNVPCPDLALHTGCRCALKRIKWLRYDSTEENRGIFMFSQFAWVFRMVGFSSTMLLVEKKQLKNVTRAKTSRVANMQLVLGALLEKRKNRSVCLRDYPGREMILRAFALFEVDSWMVQLNPSCPTTWIHTLEPA